MWSYCYDFRDIRACFAGIPPLYHSFDLPYSCPIMHTSSWPNRSFGLRIGGSFAEKLGQTGEWSDRPALVVDRVPSVGPPSLSGKGKSKVSAIKYPGGSNYLRVVVHNAKVVGPSRIEPSFVKTFATCYRPPFGVPIFSFIISSKCRKWFPSLKRPLRTTFTFLCIL